MSKPSANESWWKRILPSIISQRLPSELDVPGDVLVLGGFLLLANLVLYTVPESAVVVRALVGIPLLFFVPGYAVIAALFPGQRRTERERSPRGLAQRLTSRRDRGIDQHERLALSFGTSVAVLAPLALVMSVSGLEYTTGTVVGATTVFAFIALLLAVIYRNRLPRAERFQVPWGRWSAVVRKGIFGQNHRLDAALNVALAVVIGLSLVGVGYAVVAPNQGGAFTSVSLLTENGEGELVASGYPPAIDADGEPLTLELENHEGQTTSYTVVAELQRVEQSDGSLNVLQGSEVTRMEATLDAGETWRTEHTVEPELGGQNLRLIYYVYKGEPPENPSTETAYRHVNIWVDVPIAP